MVVWGQCSSSGCNIAVLFVAAAPLYAERSAVVNGEKEVPKEDSVAEDKPKEGEGGELVPPGIPDFWLGVMRANPIVSEHVCLPVCNLPNAPH